MTIGYEVGICPICHSEDLDYDAMEVYDDSIGYPFTCNSCGATGNEFYQLTYDSSEASQDVE